MSSPRTPEEMEPCVTAWLRSGNRKSLGDIITILRDELGEYDGVPGADNPFAQQRAVVEATNEVCRRTHCLHAEFVTDIKAGEDRYCQEPSLLLMTGLMVKDPNGIWHKVPVAQQSSAATLKSAMSWWGGISHDWQFAAAQTGTSSITLYPMPKTDRPASLWASGYFMPGNIWEIDPTTYAPRKLDRAHECPVPDFGIEAVIAESIRRRAKTLLLVRPELKELYPLYESEARRLIGQLESTVASRNEALPRSGSRTYTAWGYYR